MLMAELLGGGAILVHGLGLMVLIGRVAHAWGVSAHPQIMILRQVGMVLTFLALLIGALANLWFALF